MKIKPKTVEEDPFKELTKFQNATRIAAIAIAFMGVYFWFVKIMFL